jgi:hypothetical protein
VLPRHFPSRIPDPARPAQLVLGAIVQKDREDEPFQRSKPLRRAVLLLELHEQPAQRLVAKSHDRLALAKCSSVVIPVDVEEICYRSMSPYKETVSVVSNAISV